MKLEVVCYDLVFTSSIMNREKRRFRGDRKHGGEGTGEAKLVREFELGFFLIKRGSFSLGLWSAPPFGLKS